MSFSTPKLRVSVLDAINNNKHLFKYGKSFTRTELFKLIDGFCPYPDKITPRELMSYNLNMVATQGMFNKFLRKYGLYMRTADYYEQFYIVTREQARTKVNRLHLDAKHKQQASTQLEIGLETHQGHLPAYID